MKFLKHFFLSLLYAPLMLGAFEQKPWPSNLYEFKLNSTYTYSSYREVADATAPLRQTAYNERVDFELGFTPTESWQTDAYLEFAKTDLYAMGYQSSYLQIRCQILDDLVADPLALTTSLRIRHVLPKRLYDISCPYSSVWALEGSSMMGKEIDYLENHLLKLFSGVTLGSGSRSKPWLTAFFSLEGSIYHHHSLQFLTQFQMGFGKTSFVNPDNFTGYGDVKYRNLDLLLCYSYDLEVWGHLQAGYGIRAYAKCSPKGIQLWQIGYTLPFSLF